MLLLSRAEHSRSGVTSLHITSKSVRSKDDVLYFESAILLLEYFLIVYYSNESLYFIL